MAQSQYETERNHDHQRAWVGQLLAQAQKTEWFGTITIKVEKGVVKRVVKEESIMPPTLVRRRG